MEVTHPIILWHKLTVTIKTGELIKCITHILVPFDKPIMGPVNANVSIKINLDRL